MSSDTNTGANPNGVPFGLHGGQPLGGLAPIGQVSILERPTSPMELVSQPAAKKGRSDLDCTEGMDCESGAVEVSAGDTVQAADPIIMEGTGGAAANGADKVSYATMSAKSVTNNGRSGKNFNFSEVEVVVRDEDCLVDDSGTFPTIQFSEKVHDQIDQSSDGSSQELYGPWMMAVNRRRRIGRVEVSNVGTRRSAGIATASRFSVLNVRTGEGELPSEDALVSDVPTGLGEDVGRSAPRQPATGSGLLQDTGVRFNKSYLESNPSRRSRAKEAIANGSKRVEVVSLMDEHPVEASIRAVSMASGSHVAISVSGKGDAARSLHRRGEGLSVAKAMRHGLENDFEVMDDDDSDELQREGDAAVQSLVRRDRSSAVSMNVGPLQ
ncbi:hypothetical protein V6N11_009323 [Hibiscus sabdariffa]|uniref:Uncharacterized protein n=2 Tax=Hibiscus sabdariffa TaxID=183260 RepID=A0ABR1ZJK1_9ROSI